eukprot:TRINITY_DN4153_c0_g1_i2.p1 TRINITY_DN4153_c0_g1~~TRINITY_DN4153_c0_g1_i2.p1  ORF type:complete len:497 (+),score=76.78 TRINITY_DN4153_c0_g1_i2:163-1491(+)
MESDYVNRMPLSVLFQVFENVLDIDDIIEWASKPNNLRTSLMVVCKNWEYAIKASVQVVSLNKRNARLLEKYHSQFLSLHTVSISNPDLYPTIIPLLGFLFQYLPAFKILDISVSQLSDENAILLSKELPIASRLNTLSLGFNDFGDEGCVAIIEAIKNLNIERLSFTNCSMGEDSLEPLGSYLKSTKTLKKLDWSYNDIGYIGAVSLARGLRENSTLTKLKLRKCSIEGYAALGIGDVLKTNKSIKKLDLRDNEMGDQGASNIAEALLVNPIISSLKISNNEITDIPSLRRVLEVNYTLSVLDLSMNILSSDFITSLSHGLVANKSLTILRLANCKIDNKGLALLAFSVNHNTTLQTLDISENKIRELDGVMSIVSIVQQGNGLKGLKVNKNKLGTDGIEIVKALKSKQVLQLLEKKGCSLFVSSVLKENKQNPKPPRVLN